MPFSLPDVAVPSNHDIDLTAMKQAVLVFDQGSFRKAAALLQVRPSVVSRRVRALEDVLGVSLFQRQSHGAQATPAGRRILTRARKILDELDLLLRTARLSGEGTEGSLCVGVLCSIAGGILRELFFSFCATHRQIDLMVIESSPQDHIAAVTALRMDATFVVGKPFAPGCEVEPFWTEQIMVALPMGHRLAAGEDGVGWDDLMSERFIVSEMEPGPEIEDFIIKHLATLDRHPTVEPRPVGRDTLLALVGLGLGISLVTEAVATVAYPNVVFKALRGEELPFSVIWSTKNDNPTLRRFLSRSRVEMKRIAAERI